MVDTFSLGMFELPGNVFICFLGLFIYLYVRNGWLVVGHRMMVVTMVAYCGGLPLTMYYHTTRCISVDCVMATATMY